MAAYADLLHALDKMGCEYDVADGNAPEYRKLPRSAVRPVTIGTLTFWFTEKGNYVGRVQMSRDECDYFTPKSHR